jgi:hypothetical protein
VHEPESSCGSIADSLRCVRCKTGLPSAGLGWLGRNAYSVPARPVQPARDIDRALKQHVDETGMFSAAALSSCCMACAACFLRACMSGPNRSTTHETGRFEGTIRCEHAPTRLARRRCSAVAMASPSRACTGRATGLLAMAGANAAAPLPAAPPAMGSGDSPLERYHHVPRAVTIATAAPCAPSTICTATVSCVKYCHSAAVHRHMPANYSVTTA